MSDNEWGDKGATLSDKAAMGKYGPSRDQIYAGKSGAAGLQTLKLETEIAEVERELRAIKRSAAKLERRRDELHKMLEG